MRKRFGLCFNESFRIVENRNIYVLSPNFQACTISILLYKGGVSLLGVTEDSLGGFFLLNEIHSLQHKPQRIRAPVADSFH